MLRYICGFHLHNIALFVFRMPSSQVLATSRLCVHRVVEKVLPLDVSYSLISCVNVDKKRLKVEPLASLPAPMLPLSCSRSVCLVLSHDGQYPCSSNPL